MRMRPYKNVELAPCHVCGRAAFFSWTMQVCANGRKTVYVPLCKNCDIDLNETSIRFLFGATPEADSMIAAYKRQVLDDGAA